MEKNIHGLWIVNFMKWSRKRLIALIAYIAYSIAKIKWSIAIIKFMIPRFGNESHENDHTLLWQNFHKDVQCSNKIQQPTTVMIHGSLQCRANIDNLDYTVHTVEIYGILFCSTTWSTRCFLPLFKFLSVYMCLNCSQTLV